MYCFYTVGPRGRSVRRQVSEVSPIDYCELEIVIPYAVGMSTVTCPAHPPRLKLSGHRTQFPTAGEDSERQEMRGSHQ